MTLDFRRNAQTKKMVANSCRVVSIEHRRHLSIISSQNVVKHYRTISPLSTELIFWFPPSIRNPATEARWHAFQRTHAKHIWSLAANTTMIRLVDVKCPASFWSEAICLGRIPGWIPFALFAVHSVGGDNSDWLTIWPFFLLILNLIWYPQLIKMQYSLYFFWYKGGVSAQQDIIPAMSLDT